jgi:hypothetical protein
MEHLSYEIGTPTSTVTTGAILIATAAATGKYTR